MFGLKIFAGEPWPDLPCALASRGQCLACIKMSGPAPLRGRNIVCRKSRFGWVQTHMYYFMDSGQKFTRLLWLNAGGIDRYQLSFRFLMSCLFSEIFAIKFGSCVKSVQILHVFGPLIFWGGPLNFLDMHYKADVYIDHRAQFCGDRPGELRDPVAD